MKSIIVLLVLTTALVNAQIDTTDWYPLHIGDKWEYYGDGYGYYQVEVIGDTMMPNGQLYYKFSEGVYAWRFQRKVGNDIVYYYSTADGNEYMLFNFKLADRELWKSPFVGENWWGIFKTGSDNNNLLNYPVMYKIFERAIIDTTVNPPDTTWGYLIDAYPTRITKGFGITSYSYDLENIVGARINGKGYGTLVGIKENEEIVTEYKLHQNYPNPFNPSTTISYQISASSHVSLKIFDVLGREVAVLVNEKKSRGYYNVTFNGKNLSSGVYYYSLTSGSKRINKSMILLK
jgi:hypothetical protein